MHGKLLSWLLLFLFFSLFINLVRSWSGFSQRGDVMKKAYDRLDQAKELQDNLKRKLEGVKSQAFIEKQAREKLNLGKENEIVVILPSISPIIKVTPTPVEDLPNWKKWLRVFF